jgi:ribosomal protein S27E
MYDGFLAVMSLLWHHQNMAPILDDQRLDGPHVARISARPRRLAIPLPIHGDRTLESVISLECQIWGGGSNVVLPLDDQGIVPDLYQKIIPGSQIDDIYGALHDPDMTRVEHIDAQGPRDVSRSQLAVGLLEYKAPDKLAPVEVVALSPSDPWQGIYLACLGTLPLTIDQGLITSGNWLPDIEFSDFIEVRRAEALGSIGDLLARLRPKERTLTPRQLSMLHLSYAGTASTAIRSNDPVLPQPWFAQSDAGPNVLVVCSPGSSGDLALLWNLRAAHGDFYCTPVGVPEGELSEQFVAELLASPGLSHQGMSAATLYITSASISVEKIKAVIGDVRDVEVRSPQEMMMFGSVLGWSRDEVVVWKDGKGAFRPFDAGRSNELLDKRNFNDLLVMQFDISVESAPLPQSHDYRVTPFNGSFYNGSRTTWSSLRYGNRITDVEWPSSSLTAKSLARIRKFELEESAPGIAARILIDAMGGLTYSSWLCHGPLLELLESMAARQGFGWYKQRLRQAGVVASPGDAVGATIDELPEKSFHDFKRVFGNNEKATRYWLAWAERSSILIKGFPLQCPKCGAKQWIPIGNFSPPVTCRGCARVVDYPFGDRPSIDFKYRLSEQARRVYEVDAMGHILAARFFELVLGGGAQGRLIGMHPGMRVILDGDTRDAGEADVLLFTRWGEFIPIEVKRTSTGLNPEELRKLETLSVAMQSPWNGVVACQYWRDAVAVPEGLAQRGSDGTHSRMFLTYDALLEMYPVWTLGSDPFEGHKLSKDDVQAREQEFVKSLVERAGEGEMDWLAYSMLRRRSDT